MVGAIIPISALAYDKVQFYTIRVDGRQSSEFGDFNYRMQLNETLKGDWERLIHFIYKMKDKYGALPIYFDNDSLTKRLPYCCYIEMNGSGRMPVRLYCLWLFESVVFLLNGDKRTNLNIANCPNCFVHFELAQRIDHAINQAVKEGKVRVDGETKTLIMEEDFKILL